tara:strand:- start:99 stop:341 length:243 start_codon:yes stop_codon:yes gene_type:complete
MISIKQMVGNPIIMGVLSAIIAALAFILNSKIRKQDIDNISVMKTLLLGFGIGCFNTILIIYFISSKSSDPDMFIGNPDF